MPPRTRAPQRRREEAAAPAAPVVPFIAAAHEHIEPAADVTITPGAAAQQLGPFDVPAYGYFRHFNWQVDATGGTLGAGVLSADYPFNAFASIQCSDVNGGDIVAPLDGYALLWANIIGGYAGRPDPRALPSFIGTINAAFNLRLPIEISHRDGFGALANQSSAAQYRVLGSVPPSATLYSTAPTTIPAFRFRGSLEAWSVPDEYDMANRRQADVPPMLGTTQYVSQFQRDTQIGNNTVLLPRQGNLIRALVIIARTAAGVRADNVFGDPVTYSWDNRNILQNVTQTRMIQLLSEKVPDLTARDAGVFAIPFTAADHNVVGDDPPQLWLPTVQSTRMQLDGAAAAAGRWQLITMDVAPAEVRPEERYVLTSATGHHPAVGIAAVGAGTGQ